ncbi:DUF456 domain-containing protein [Nocardioides cynanchi]|uniref:DUF456 domain-containing protein n=1 Tax=Nocardioides cynanchi TaxID=2558918 RepID=UPI0012475FBB|nr:DUF456 domain-containing protein [Nocardioides cynanchi]
MTGTDVICGLLVVVGLFGIVVPVLPGTLLVLLGILVWASADGSGAAWAVFAVATACLAVGAVVKYAVPGRRLRAAVPTSTLVVGGVGAVIGFFVIPVVGVLLGFPVGIYLAERARVGAAGAWPSTREALRAMGLSVLIELAAAVVAVGVWVTGVVLT